MKTITLSILASSALLASAGVAQNCSTLGATWDPATNTLATALTGAPANARTMTLASFNQGTTTMMHGLTLGLAMPLSSMFFGITDFNGNLNWSRVLTRVPTGITVYFQAVSMDMTGGMGGGGMGGGGMGGGGMGGGGMGGGGMGMTFCVSNVASVAFP